MTRTRTLRISRTSSLEAFKMGEVWRFGTGWCPCRRHRAPGNAPGRASHRRPRGLGQQDLITNTMPIVRLFGPARAAKLPVVGREAVPGPGRPPRIRGTTDSVMGRWTQPIAGILGRLHGPDSGSIALLSGRNCAPHGLGERADGGVGNFRRGTWLAAGRPSRSGQGSWEARSHRAIARPRKAARPPRIGDAGTAGVAADWSLIRNES